MSKYYNPDLNHLIENPVDANCDKYELCRDCPVYKKFLKGCYPCGGCSQYFHEKPAEATGLLGYVEVPDNWKIGSAVSDNADSKVYKAYSVLVEAMYGQAESDKSLSEAIEEAIGYLGEALE